MEHIFRGQVRKYGEKVNLAGEKLPSIWVYGGICQGKNRSIIYGGEFEDVANKHVVYSETIGQFTGMCDEEGERIFVGDIVGMFGNFYEVILCAGSFGLYSEDVIDYTKLEEAIEPLTGCNNPPHFMYCDNFISFAEIHENYNCEENVLFCVSVVGNIHNNSIEDFERGE